MGRIKTILDDVRKAQARLTRYRVHLRQLQAKAKEVRAVMFPSIEYDTEEYTDLQDEENSQVIVESTSATEEAVLALVGELEERQKQGHTEGCGCQRCIDLRVALRDRLDLVCPKFEKGDRR
jgi:hypothetical protein